jgi:hypothetical protein
MILSVFILQSYNGRGELNYLDLMATTGSIFDAIMAGMIPASIPIAMQMKMANPKICVDTKIGKLKAVLSN